MIEESHGKTRDLGEVPLQMTEESQATCGQFDATVAGGVIGNGNAVIPRILALSRRATSFKMGFKPLHLYLYIYLANIHSVLTTLCQCFCFVFF